MLRDADDFLPNKLFLSKKLGSIPRGAPNFLPHAPASSLILPYVNFFLSKSYVASRTAPTSICSSIRSPFAYCVPLYAKSPRCPPLPVLDPLLFIRAENVCAFYPKLSIPPELLGARPRHTPLLRLPRSLFRRSNFPPGCVILIHTPSTSRKLLPSDRALSVIERSFDGHAIAGISDFK